MPISIHCSICGARSPRFGFARRMAWLRRHRENQHPAAFRKSLRKAAATRRRNLQGVKMLMLSL